MKSRPHESLVCRCRDCRQFDGAEDVEEHHTLAPGWWPDDEDLLPDAERITEPAVPAKEA